MPKIAPSKIEEMASAIKERLPLLYLFETGQRFSLYFDDDCIAEVERGDQNFIWWFYPGGNGCHVVPLARPEGGRAGQPMFGDDLQDELDDIRDMLLEKREAYGDSASSPLRIFSKADTDEQLLVRIDDKLSRIARGSGDNEDTILDLIGYLIMLRLARKSNAEG